MTLRITRFIGPFLVMVVALVAAVMLLSVLVAVIMALSGVGGSRDQDPSSSAASFSLAPPEFLLRLGLFPDQQRKRRLIGVMVENQETARLYHQGLQDALFVAEFHVEGMISRFLTIFDVQDLPPVIGPIRSLRPYFVDASQPWIPVIIHAGGSPEAFERVAVLSGVTAINALRYDDGEYFVRSETVPAPHDLFLPTSSINALLDKNLIMPGEDIAKGYPLTVWPPYPTGAQQPGGSGATIVRIDYFSTSHNVEYRLLPDGAYVRVNGGTESALQPRNVLILEMPITEIGELGRLTIPVEGEGPLLLFRSGSMYRGFWKKENATASWEFLGVDGKPLRFAGGATWMTVVPDLGRVEWE